MKLSVVLLPLGAPPHLPPLVDEDHEAILPGLVNTLSEEYAAEVVRIKSAHASTPHMLLSRLSRLSRDTRAAPPNLLLLLIRSYATVFERNGEKFCTVSVRDSVSGRPGSMLSVNQLVGSLASSFHTTRFFVLADLDLLPSSSYSFPPSPKEAALTALENGLRADSERTSLAIHMRASTDPSKYRKVSLARALDSTFRCAADAGTTTSLSDVASTAGGYLAEYGSTDFVSQAQGQISLIPHNHTERFPDYLRADLYSPDSGSRLDAVVELAGLARSGGSSLASSQLKRLHDTDISADVRGYAANFLRDTSRPSIEKMVEFGFLPPGAIEAVNRHCAVPPFTRTFQGTGIMGVNAPLGQEFEHPTHSVSIDPFRMALRPTTNLDYLAYVISTGAECPAHWNSGWVFSEDLNHPVVMVSWYEARQYCQWLTEDARIRGVISSGDCLTLPTEAEWEISARSVDGSTHPWGDDFRPKNCNVRSTGVGRVVGVGSFSPAGDSSEGCIDLIGNVWEWTSSAWGKSGRLPQYTYPYDAGDGREDPDLHSDVRRVVRGGGFYYADICANSYTRNRVAPAERHVAGGFRVVVRPRKVSAGE